MSTVVKKCVIMAGADELLSHQTSGQGGNIAVTDTSAASDDLLCIDEALSLLDPLALDELQILAESHILADAMTENSLRYEWSPYGWQFIQQQMYVIVDLAVVYLLPPGLKWSGSQCYVALYIIFLVLLHVLPHYILQSLYLWNWRSRDTGMEAEYCEGLRLLLYVCFALPSVLSLTKLLHAPWSASLVSFWLTLLISCVLAAVFILLPFCYCIFMFCLWKQATVAVTFCGGLLILNPVFIVRKVFHHCKWNLVIVQSLI